MTAADWDARYSAQKQLWSGEPNPQLVTEASDVPAGRALDAPTGEGADAIWLAQRGWTVTAVDFSRAALERGRTAAHIGASAIARSVQAFVSTAEGRILLTGLRMWPAP